MPNHHVAGIATRSDQTNRISATSWSSCIAVNDQFERAIRQRSSEHQASRNAAVSVAGGPVPRIAALAHSAMSNLKRLAATAYCDQDQAECLNERMAEVRQQGSC